MTLWHFLAYLIFTCQVAGQSPIYALQGREVNFKPNTSGRPDAILWRHNGKMVVEFDGQVERVYGPYENRIILDWDTAELDITDLRFEDSGDYELRKYTEVLQRFHYKLEVLDKVAKPTISCEMNDGGGSNKSGTLVCSAEPRQPQSLMTFEWRFHGKVQPGPELTISLGDEYDDEVYNCRVRNPLSKGTATFTAKDCYPGNDSVLIGVLVPIAILFSLLPMGLGIIYCKKHHKACFANDPEKLTHPGETKGSDENTADECRGPIDRTPTIPSTQRLHQEHDGDLQDTWPKEGHVKIMKKRFESVSCGQAELTTFPAVSPGHVRNKIKHFESKNEKRVCAPPFPHNKETAEDDEKRPLLDTTLTPPSTHPLDYVGDLGTEKGLEENKDENEETGSLPSTPRSESPSSLDPSNPAINDKGDADADRLSELAEEQDPHPDSSDYEKENEPKPADVSTNTMSDLEPSTASEHQDLEKDEDEEGKSPPANAVTPVPKPRSQLNQNSQNTAPEVNAGGRKEDTEEVNGETDTSGVGETNESDLEENKDENEETGSPPSTPHSESPSSLDASNDKGDTNADRLSKPAEEESPHHEKENEPKPADASTNTMSDPEPSTAPEHQDLEKDEDEEGKSPPANVVTPVPKLRSQLAQNSPNTAPEVNAGGQKKDTEKVSGETDTSDIGETNESGASSKEEQLSPVSEQKDSEKTRHDQDPNLSQSETHTSEDNQQEMDKPVPAAEKESGSEGNSEETDLSSASSHQPQSSTPTKPDNRSTGNFKETPDAAHEEQVQGGEGKTRTESDESGESEDDTDEDKK